MKIIYKLIFSILIVNIFLTLTPKTTLAATYTVTKTADTNDGTCDADCSLREAIDAANNNAGNDTIEFNIPEGDGGFVPASGDTHSYWTITLGSTITLSDDDGVYINGYSQPGSSRNTASFGNTLNTVLKIQLNGRLLFYSDNNHLSGTNFFGSATASVMFISSGGSNNWIEGNFLGSNITGDQVTGGGMIGLAALGGDVENNNTVGTNGDGNNDVGERNLIVNNLGWTNGVDFQEGSGHVIAGNYFGVDKTTRTCINENTSRVIIQTGVGSNNRIGTNYDGVSDSEEANIIACVNLNSRALIRVLAGENNSYIQGNYIGTNTYGDALSDFDIPGIWIYDSLSGDNTIKGNTIAHNVGGGITFLNQSVSGITIRENKIYSNGDVPQIRLNANSGVTENDSGDTDTGANNLMNYPVIEHAEYLGAGRFWIHGILDGNPSEAPYTIEVCRASDHSTAHGGCLESLGVISISSPGAWDMYVNVSEATENNLISFSSLATNASGSTSEFGKNIGGRMPLIGPSIARSSSDYISSAPLPTTIVSSNSVTSLVGDNVFKWDTYLDIAQESTVPVKKIAGYWQATPIWEVWWKSTFNNAKILQQEVLNPFTLVFNYNPSSIDPNLSTKNLKVAFSEDKENWKIIPGSIQDIIRNNIAIVTKNGGYFTLVAGY